MHEEIARLLEPLYRLIVNANSHSERSTTLLLSNGFDAIFRVDILRHFAASTCRFLSIIGQKMGTFCRFLMPLLVKHYIHQLYHKTSCCLHFCTKRKPGHAELVYISCKTWPKDCMIFVRIKFALTVRRYWVVSTRCWRTGLQPQHPPPAER